MIYPSTQYITLKIIEPKTSVHLNPSLDTAREIQVLDFHRVRKPFIRKQDMPQNVYEIKDDGTETELFVSMLLITAFSRE